MKQAISKRAVPPLPWCASWAGFLLLLGLGFSAAAAQQSEVRWSVAADPSMDLWFHGMALIGVQGPGGAPLYDVGYGAEMRGEKERRGIAATPLDQAVPTLRAAVASESELELLHFLPLYFPGVSRSGLLQAVEAISTAGSGVPAVADPRAEFGATAIASIIRDPDQREVLGVFAEALEEEWNLFYGNYWRDRQVRVEGAMTEAGRTFNESVLPAAAPFLRGFGLQAGRLMPSPPVGLEGRILAGDPSNPWDNQVVVGLEGATEDVSGLVTEITARFLKEACYPAVREAMSASGLAGSDPVADARISSDAATRCGGMVLDRFVPSMSQEYSNWVLDARGGTNSPSTDLQEAFPLPPALERALLQVIQGAS
jgi:hypothetical protein